MTLDNQLKSLVRTRNETIESYYSRVRELISLISSAISMDDQWRGHEHILMRLYNQIALDTFIRGLGDPLSRFCKNYRPLNLAQAYAYCVDYLNVDARNAPVQTDSWKPAPIPAPRQTIPMTKPTIPPRIFNAPPMPPPRHNNQFPFQPSFPQRNPMQNFSGFPPRNVFSQNRTFTPALPRPSPMEVDASLRTHAINYGNRPNNIRRPATDSMRANGPQNKRFAHLTEQYPTPEEYEKWFDEPGEYYYETFEEPEPTEELQEEVLEAEANPKEATETNFLENRSWAQQWEQKN